MIDIKLITAVRELTGAGVSDVKNALEEALGNQEKAVEILRQKGIVKAAKRAGKTSAEGLTSVKVAGNKAVILELNCETDFAAKSDKFKNLLAEVTDKVLAGETMSGESLGSATSAIGEKIILRRSVMVEKADNETFGAYIHLGGKISALVVLTNTADVDVARDVAMQVAASNPQFLTSADVSPEVLAKEKAVYAEQLKQEGKPENMLENIIKGKLNKFYSEVCLMDQSFIKDEDLSMAKYLAGKGVDIKVKSMVRYEVGEGIEKAACDFVAEVAEQMK